MKPKKCPKDADQGSLTIGKGCTSKIKPNPYESAQYCTRKKHKHGKHHSHDHGHCDYTWTTEELVIDAL